MSANTITVINQGAGSGVSNNSQSNVSRATKPTSVNNTFQKRKNFNMSKSIKWLNIASNINIGGALSMMGGGMAMATATAKSIGDNTRKIYNAVSNFQQAKTGEEMTLSNRRTKLGLILNPIQGAKGIVWNDLMLEQQRINRQNEALEYNRQLVGNVIYSKNMQKGTF